MSEEQEAQPAPERWVYLGQYQHGTKIGHAWRDAAGETRRFQKVKGRIHGAYYQVQVVRAADSISVYGEAVYLGDWAPDRAQIQLEAEERLRRIKVGQLERSTTRSAALDEALEPLLEIATRLLPDERRALVDYVTAKVYGAKRVR